MWPFGRSLAIGLLILAFSHAPIPWAHSHAGLSAAQLQAHACEFHPGVPLAKLPQDWHVHCLFQLALGGDVGATEVLDSDPTRRCEKSHSRAQPCVIGISSFDIWSTLGLARLPTGRMRHSYPSRDLFKKYGAFLI